LKGKETEPAPKPTDLTQTIRKRKRRVLPDNTIINVSGTPAPVKKAKKSEEGEIPVQPNFGKETEVDEKGSKPKAGDDDAMNIDQPVTSPKKTPKKPPNKPPPKANAVDEEMDVEKPIKETPKHAPAKRKAEDDSQDVVAAKRRRKNPPLENEAILTTKRFADLIKAQVPNSVTKVNLPGVEEPVNDFVEKYIAKHGSIRTFPKKAKNDAPVSNLPPHPRSQVLTATEERQRRRLATLQEEKAVLETLKSKSIKADVRRDDLEFPAAPDVSQSLRLLSDEERAFVEKIEETPAEFKSTLENIVLQTDELLLRTKQIAELGNNIEDYFSRVARALRREEIGEGAPLAFGGFKQ
jgi:hypothetical protein